MRSAIKKILFYILRFIEANINFKVRNRTSPIDIYYENLSKDCYDFFKKDMENASIFLKPKDIRSYAISKSLKNLSNKSNLFLEFGVFRGESINLFAEILNEKKFQIYGFDSFEGLEEEWNMNEYNPIGTFSLKQKLPKVRKNAILIKGKVQDTIDNFLEKNKEKKIIFAHFDMDTYTPTKYALKQIKKYLTKGSVILFDQFYAYPNWQRHEYRAFIEIFNKEEYQYIAFSESEVAIEITNQNLT